MHTMGVLGGHERGVAGRVMGGGGCGGRGFRRWGCGGGREMAFEEGVDDPITG